MFNTNPPSTPTLSNMDIFGSFDMNELLSNYFNTEEDNTNTVITTDIIQNDSPTTTITVTHPPSQYQSSPIIPPLHGNKNTKEVWFDIHPHQSRNGYKSFCVQPSPNETSAEEFSVQSSVIHEQYLNNGHNRLLHGQGSLTIPQPHNKKTLDEIWGEIHPDHQRSDTNFATQHIPCDEIMLGECNWINKPNCSLSTVNVPLFPPLNPQQHTLMAFHQPFESEAMYENHVQQFEVNEVNHAQQIIVPGYTTQLLEMDNRLTSANQVTQNVIGSSANYKGNYTFGGEKVDGLRSNGRKRGMTDERKIERMVKKRESAARSYARKKANLMGLELGVKRLKEENARLSAKNMQVQKMLVSNGIRDERPRENIDHDKRLRRCVSCSF